LVLSRDPDMLARLMQLIEAEGFDAEGYASPAELFQGVPDGRCLVLAASTPGDEEAGEVLRRTDGRMPVILISDGADVCRGARVLTERMFDVFETRFSPPDLLRSVEAAVGGSVESEGPRWPALEELTKREREVLQQLIMGHSAKVIAKGLGISPRTVEVHRARIRDKLSARNLADLVRIAMQGLNAMQGHALV
jgi:two-component system response regulator FixJ